MRGCLVAFRDLRAPKMAHLAYAKVMNNVCRLSPPHLGYVLLNSLREAHIRASIPATLCVYASERFQRKTA